MIPICTCIHVQVIVSELGDLRKLKVLSLGDNQLTTLPGSVCQLENLTSLQLSKNQLTSLPSGSKHNVNGREIANYPVIKSM
jgi:Leucine-rich repeat (LRR) protein